MVLKYIPGRLVAGVCTQLYRMQYPGATGRATGYSC